MPSRVHELLHNAVAQAWGKKASECLRAMAEGDGQRWTDARSFEEALATAWGPRSWRSMRLWRRPTGSADSDCDAEPIDPVRVRELFTYRPDTGVLRWAKPIGHKTKVGNIAGVMKDGAYWQIKIEGRRFRRSRRAWACYYGEDAWGNRPPRPGQDERWHRQPALSYSRAEHGEPRNAQEGSPGHAHRGEACPQERPPHLLQAKD